MARSGRPTERTARQQKPLPPPLPPETRTVGQLVAESIRLYGRRFWPSLALGIGPGATTVGAYEVGAHAALAIVAVAWIVTFSVAYTGACFIVAHERPGRDRLRVGFAVGAVVGLPMPVLSALGILPGVIWFAAVGLSVPAAVLEGASGRRAFSRGFQLARADFVHALGSIAALAIVVFLTQILLFSLLHGASRQGIAVAGFLASLVIGPLLFLGAALLYYDQEARLSSRPTPRRRRRRDAHVPDALDADRPGPANAPVQPRAAARGKPGH
jgi:hypothetical protein